MENQDQPAEQQAQPAPELGIADLQNLRTLVDVAVRRGAFGAAELSSVGAVFDRVNAFLNAVAPQPTKENAGAENQEQQTAQ